MAEEARRALEALLMVAEDSATPQLLAQLLEISTERVDELCAELAAEYERDERGFVLVRVAGGYRYQSHPSQSAYVERFVLEGQSSRLSAAALETLSIVAYKQPISRAQIASIRGVSVDGVMRTLQQRGYIDEVAHDPGPGQAIMFGTTRQFLERLGIDSLDDLPQLAEFVPGADVVEALEMGLRFDAAASDEDTEGPSGAPDDTGTDDEPEPAPAVAGPSAWPEDASADGPADDGDGDDDLVDHDSTEIDIDGEPGEAGGERPAVDQSRPPGESDSGFAGDPGDAVGE